MDIYIRKLDDKDLFNDENKIDYYLDICKIILKIF